MEQDERHTHLVDHALDTLDDVFIVFDLEWNLISWNKKVSEVTGYSNEELPSMKILDFLEPDDLRLVSEAIARAHEDELPAIVEVNLLTRDGTAVAYEFYGSLLKGPTGDTIGVTAIGRDISERERAAEAIGQSEERLRIIAGNVLDIIWTTDINLNFTYASPSVKRQMGYAVEEALTLKLQDFLTPASLEFALQRYAGELDIASETVSDPPVPVVVELELIRKDGTTFWTEMSMGFLRLPDDTPYGILGISRDITERKRVEEELSEYRELLEEQVRDRTEELESANLKLMYLNRRLEENLHTLSNVNRELDAFSYSVSHDLQAPLRAIKGFSHMLEEMHSHQLDEEGLRLLGVVKQNTEHMGVLIDDLLTFSRTAGQELRKSEVDMQSLVDGVMHELMPTFEGRQVEFNIGYLPPAFCDASMMRLVLVNLLSNAIKFTRPRELARIEVDAMDEGDTSVYYVKDNGVGFDQRYEEKLYGVFHRLHGDDEFEGTGVGLALAQRIVLRHSGRLWAESTLGEGAIFYFTIPDLEADLHDSGRHGH
jgi:PAS domain S-box-containing protein